MRQSQYALYFQDNFKATRNLTFNLGLRWQAWPAMHEKYGNITGFDIQKKAIVLTQGLDRYYQLNPAMARGVARLRELGANSHDYREAGIPRDLVFSNWSDAARLLRVPHVERQPPVGGYGADSQVRPLPCADHGPTRRCGAGIPLREQSDPHSPDAAGHHPDGRPGFSLRSTPQYVAGANTRNVLDNALGTGRVDRRFAYRVSDRPTLSRRARSRLESDHREGSAAEDAGARVA